MKSISGGVTAPRGFRAAGFAAHIKLKSTKKDCALVVSDSAASVAGMFTTNIFKAPPVMWTEQMCQRGASRGVFINSGNANACTGEEGLADVAETARLAALAIGATAEGIGVLSTGVIGVRLPMARIQAGVEACAAALSVPGGKDAAEAIMTTDTVPKEIAIEISLGNGTVRLGAMAKGSGMICPNMATMICVITTDAAVEPAALSMALRGAVGMSINRICVDNDMSTSDCVLCLANGASGLPALEPGTEAFAAFQQALNQLCQDMAKALVRDGEGATKLVEIRVSGAASDEDASRIARAVGQSQLCKTAFYGEDPNWGRIACAAGYAGVAFEPSALSIWLDEVQVAQAGRPTAYEEEAAAAVMKQREFAIRLTVGGGSGESVFWTSDLSVDYVHINADYRS